MRQNIPKICRDTVVLFDFDGTIADTFHHLIEIGNQLSEEFDFRAIGPEEVDGLKDKHVQDIIKHLNIPLLKVPAIAAKAKRELHKQIGHVKPVDGLENVLMEIKKIGIQIGIITSNSSKNVQSFLKGNRLDIFDFIHTTSKIWSKNRSIKSMINEHGFSLDRVYYVGDETRDIIAAHKAGIRSVAVTWGYNSIQALEKQNPHFMVHRPQELLSLFS